MKLFLISCLASFSLAHSAHAQFALSEIVLDVNHSLEYAVPIDWDLDGDQDLVISEFSSTQVYFFQLESDLTYTSIALPGPIAQTVFHVDVHDFDGDGYQDILVGTYDNFHWFRNNGGQSFDPMQDVFPSPAHTAFFAFHDVNRDGRIDLLRQNRDKDDLELHLGLPSGAFDAPSAIPQTSGTIFSMVSTDLDGDLNLDLVLGRHNQTPLHLEFFAQGAPSVTSLGLLFGNYLSVGDLDGDGDQDIVFSNLLSGLAWAENLGDGTFSTETLLNPNFVWFDNPIIMDVDGDGDMDIVTANLLSGRLVWFRNLGGGSFAGAADQDWIDQSNFMLASDFDKDGAVDILAGGGPDNVIHFYRNTIELGFIECTPNQNSTGLRAQLAPRGTRVAELNRVRMQLRQAPPGQFAVLVNSQTPGLMTPQGSMGVLCLGPSYGRYNRPGEFGMTSNVGERFFELDLLDTPQMLGSTAILAGQTWYFQAWFRDMDPGPTSNFSEAIRIPFE